MPYTSESAKWNAYQFNDPFASDKFIVCNKSTKICCRPNCDLSLQTSLKSEVVFTKTVEEAETAGFVQCPHCLISNDNNDLNTISIDVDLLIKTVTTVNEQIGFVQPLDDEAPDTQNIREAVLRKSKLRRGSVPAIHFNSEGITSPPAKNTSASITKNETDHVKLVDLACRHIALAAASTAVQLHEDETNAARKQARQQQEHEQQVAEEKANNGNKKRRRRGGVLGFKELASKSKLSPWHFHRVFKSVTGLTPKVYGDKCWEFVKKYIDQYGSFSSNKAITMSTSITNPTTSPPDEQTTGINTMNLAKARRASKVKSEDNYAKPFSPDDSEVNHASPFSSTGEDFATTPHSTNSLSARGLTSPEMNQKGGINFGAYSMAPARNEMMMDHMPALDSFLNSNDVVNFDALNLTPELTQASLMMSTQQPQQKQQYQQIPAHQFPSHTASLPEDLLLDTTLQLAESKPMRESLSLNLQDLDLSKNAMQDWNFLQAQNSTSLFPLPSANTLQQAESFQKLQPELNAGAWNEALNNTLGGGHPQGERANSDMGDYVQTPFNFDLNNYGYFGDMANSMDPLDTSPATTTFRA